MISAFNKDEAAQQLIEWHFRVEPFLREVFRMLAEDENAHGEPIKLLEIKIVASLISSMKRLFPREALSHLYLRQPMKSRSPR